jgi:hypothetical protein
VKIVFTKHATEKFDVLKRHSFDLSKKQVVMTVEDPDIVDTITRKPLLIAQKQIDDTHVLRVVYKYEGGSKKVITFYPGRVSQYGKGK